VIRVALLFVAILRQGLCSSCTAVHLAQLLQDLLAMFDPSKLFASLTARQDHVESRSRSPVRAGAAGPAQIPSSPAVDDTVPPAWTTGIPACDEWLLSQVYDTSVLTEFAHIPMYSRKRIALKCIETPPSDAVRWLSACIRNQKTKELENRLMGPSPQSASRPLSGESEIRAGSCANLSPGTIYTDAPRRRPLGASSSSTGQPTNAAIGVQSHVISKAPTWARRALSFYPEKKGRFLTEVYEQLSASTGQSVQALEPQWQVGVCLAVCLLCDDSEGSIDCQVRCALQRLAADGEPRNPVPRALDMEAAVTNKKLTILPVLCFPRLAVTTLSHFCAANILKSLRPDLKIEWLPALLVSAEVQDQEAASALARNGCQVQLEKMMIQPTMLMEHLRAQAPQFKQTGVKFLFMNVFTADADSEQLQADQVLHSEGLRVCWLIAAVVRMLRAACGATTVAEWTLLANSKTESQKSAVSSLFGKALDSAEGFERYLVLALDSTIVTNPIGVSSSPLSSPIDHNIVLDGWRPHAVVETMAAPNTWPRVSAAFPKCLQDTLFGDQPTDAALIGSMVFCRMVHSTTGDVRYWSVAMFLKVLGYGRTPMQAMISDIMPCHERILPTTGQKAAAENIAGKPCGEKRYCLNCEAALEMLLRTRDLPSIVDSLVALLLKTLTCWSDFGGVSWHESSECEVAHICGKQCPIAVRR
jgi:hypothetical protein